MLLTLLLACAVDADPMSALPPPASPLRWADEVARPVEGGALSVLVDGGVAGAQAVLLGTGQGAAPDATCPSGVAGCVDLIGPRALAQLRLPAGGGARRVTVALPAGMAAGTPIFLQAAQRGLRVSPVAVTRVVAACAPDAAEPDDDAPRAVLAQDGDRLVQRTACADLDVLRVPARRGDHVRVVVRAPVDDDPLYATVSAWNRRVTRRADGLDVEALAAEDGDVLISLYTLDHDPAGEGIGAPYEADVTVTPSGLAACAEEPTEGSPAPVVFGQPLSGVICNADRADPLELSVIQGRWYELEAWWDPADTALAPPTFAVDPYLYGAGQYYVPFGEPGHARVRFQAASTGPLLAELSTTEADLSRLAHPWTSIVREDMPPAPCVDDALEPNDDPAHATPGGAWTGLSLCPTSHRDVFAVDTAGPALLRLDAPAQDGLTRVRLLDPTGAPYACVDGCTPPVQVGVRSAGTWLVEVELVGVAPRPVDTHWSPEEHGVAVGTAYDLDVQVSPPPACPVDPFEPNDDPATAPTLTPGATTGHQLCDGDEADRFRIWLHAGEELIVDARAPATWLALQVTGPGGEALTTPRAPATPDTRVTAWQDGWHTIALQVPEIAGYRGWTAGPTAYDLDLRVAW